MSTHDYSQYDRDFDRAEPVEGGSGSEPPDGKYQVEIEDVKENTARSGARKISVFSRILNGPHKGRMLFKNWTINDSSMPYIKTDFKKMGLPAEKKKFSELVPMLYELIGSRYNVVKMTKDGSDFYNVFFDSFIEMSGRSSKGGDSDSDENLPF